jgi:para-nitrobenzyl esterase
MPTTRVETEYGVVQGTQAGPLGEIGVWRGIPYAQPPMGALRWQAPQPPQPWAGIRTATAFGHICPQPEMQSIALSGRNAGVQGEDCLSLNVWSPGTEGARRPVMVWIHGGSFLTGSGSTPWYDGTAFARHGDMVVVTINYRVGALGFLYFGELVRGDSVCYVANYGLLDQIAALQWVQRNIAAFGGDPNNVTVFGESAGAMSVGTLMAMPAARGLFHRAIMQSGSSHTALKAEQAAKRTRIFLDALGLASNALAQLAEIPVERLLAAQAQLVAATAGLAFSPVIDGVTLLDRPVNAIASGSAAGIATLIGTNRDEMRLFTISDAAQATPNLAQLQRAFGDKAEQVMQTYMAHAARADSVLSAWNDFLTDRTFRIPAIRLAEAQADQKTPTWMYRFDWPTPILNGALGACHALEIPFVFDNLDKPGVKMFLGDAPPQVLANAMHAAWIAFAQHGDPNSAGLPHWPRYERERRATRIFNTTCSIEDDPQTDERQLWEDII